MKEIYGDYNYDMVGNIVGVVEKERIIEGKKIKSGEIELKLQ